MIPRIERPKTILAVENTPEIQMLISAIADEIKFDKNRLLFASNPTEAEIKLEQISEALPDLIILDLNFGSGEETGLSFLRKLKSKDSKYKGIRVIVTSVNFEPEIITECLEAGADDFLPRPYESIDNVKEVLTKYL